MSMKILNADERRAYESLVDEACDEHKGTGLRVAAFLRKLADAVQAHESWAGIVSDECMARGAASLMKTRIKTRNTVLVAFNGVVVSKPAMVGVRRKSEAGEYVQQTLIYTLSWDELAEKKHEYITGRKAYDANVALVDKLLALQTLAPDTATPQSAAEVLGITVEGWLTQGLAVA